MATESAITTEGSHPYSTSEDECLVHNGSLSNHNNVRRSLIKENQIFNSENDTEVAAGYISNQISKGKEQKATQDDQPVQEEDRRQGIDPCRTEPRRRGHERGGDARTCGWHAGRLHIVA